MKNKKLHLTAIIGFPLKHSLSPLLHNTVYKKMNIPAAMIKIENEEIKEVMKIFSALSIKMAAVTMPHKQSIIPYLQTVSKEAKAIGAVNTIIKKNGKLYGHNTDIHGIEKALDKVALNKKNVLLLGAGGVARPVAYVIMRNGGKLFCANRTRTKAVQLAKEFKGETVELKKLNPRKIDIIINTTPIGMHPKTKDSPLPKNFIQSHHIIFDLIYNPVETTLIKQAKKIKAKTISGFSMFIAQGLEQIHLWTGKKIKQSNALETLLRRHASSL